MRRNTNADRYEWQEDVREWVDRITNGSVSESDLATQAYINDGAKQVQQAVDELRRVLPGGPLLRVYDTLIAPLKVYLKMVTVARSRWATPAVDPAAALFRGFYGRK